MNIDCQFIYKTVSAQLRQYADHASKAVTPNAFKIMAMQTESARDEGVAGLSECLTGLVQKMGSASPFFEGVEPGNRVTHYQPRV